MFLSMVDSTDDVYSSDRVGSFLTWSEEPQTKSVRHSISIRDIRPNPGDDPGNDTEVFVYKEYFVNIMGTISARVPDKLETELETYLEAEKLDRSTAVRKLLSEGLEEWRRERALESLAAGDVTVSKAAERAGMSVWDFAQLAKERDITWVDGDHLEDDLEAL